VHPQEIQKVVHVLMLGSTGPKSLPVKMSCARPWSHSRQCCIEISTADELIALWKLSNIVTELGPQVCSQFAGLSGLVIHVLVDRQDVSSPLCMMDAGM